MHPTIISSKIIGEFAGEPMHAWVEQYADGSLHAFEDYATTVYAPSLGRDVGLTMVREVA
jgi:hypothetical protein